MNIFSITTEKVRSRYFSLLYLFLWLYGMDDIFAQRQDETRKMLTMDMVHHNPGEAQTDSRFLDPAFLKATGYDAKVFFLFEAAQFGIDWQDFDGEIFPHGGPARKWVEQKNDTLQLKYSAAKQAGLKVYCMLDMLVFPKKLVEKNREGMCNGDGKIDISLPFTQQCIRSLIGQMFQRYPQLDGLVIRTGETYLQDAPYHTGGSPLVHGYGDHVALINILREEVCQNRDKDLFYRTWDFGKFHALPKYYLEVTEQVEPHPRLYFSIKHTIVDFWRSAITDSSMDYSGFDAYWLDEASRHGVPFNPCIGIGRHQQVIEVQAQREYEGKAAHANYIADGVINGFEELKTAGIRPYSLDQVKDNPLIRGVWTWSRGGGWRGPYAANEFWPELNAHVVTQWARDPDRSEEEVFRDFALSRGLPEAEIPLFRRLCLMSAQGVMRGHYSMMGGVYVNWTRDDNISGLHLLRPYFDSIIARNTAQAYLDEKTEALEIWKEIERLSEKLHFPDGETSRFVRLSSTYGRMKFQLFDAAWKVMLNAYAGEKTGKIDLAKLRENLEYYDRTLSEWTAFADGNPTVASAYLTSYPYGREDIGIGKTIDYFRKKLE
ncbi:hypothetical protein [Olivibacter sitiensis]|uniref:hypothetical protein n=1 Tax=Olivibacter sitiensis TaxID=376470 RepID=UPI0004029F36|nr:hypothetical protein [Olivibacter sitiensis]